MLRRAMTAESAVVIVCPLSSDWIDGVLMDFSGLWF